MNMAFEWLKRLFGGKKVMTVMPKNEHSDKIYEIEHVPEEVEEIYSLWDYLRFLENSQAHHIREVLGFNEWVEMDELRRRIKEVFGIDYKNQRSLYPYIKTLVDIGLLESVDAGGKRKWRKKDLIIKIKRKKLKETEKEELLVS